ncbi:putative membrane protease YugP [Flavobacteriaceae bacterium UJ101]|nr:putative membrane protease YugP [Flavobacteriaceae bacterium UJ101]
MDMTYMILTGAIFLISTLVSGQLKSKFKKYSQIHLRNGMSGKEVAEKMLADNGITDVKVISVRGQLTDHYNPANKTVNLSEVVYHERNAAAAAVAAHECGHAIQHAKGYAWLNFRSKMVPAVQFSSKFVNIALMGGLALMAMSGSTLVLKIAIALFAVTVLFSVVTLPVEFDASKRALAWMEARNIVTQEEYAGSKDSLKWAAMTYVVAALGAIAQLLYFISMLNRRN